MTAVIVAYSFVNVARATLSPVAFSTAMGLPTSADNLFVDVYAVRTAFVALFALMLMVRRAHAELALFAGVAVVIPLADAVLVAASAGAAPYVAKHLAIAAYLAVTSGLLARGVKS